MEIERKFLIDEPPRLDRFERSEIEQGYLSLADPEGGAEVRLRRRGDELTLTAKSGGGRVREEEEIELERGRVRASLAPDRGPAAGEAPLPDPA